jgi:biotin carboxyl carrier protein
LKWRIELDNETYLLDLTSHGERSEYVLRGALESSGAASVVQLTPGVFSVLLGARSFHVSIAPSGESLETWAGTQRHSISFADPRDRAGQSKKGTAHGPLELRSQMPGKVIKVLVSNGARVQAGQGLIVVEAMKMQNEMKSPKDGVVSKIQAIEGATVAAGETLMLVE